MIIKERPILMAGSMAQGCHEGWKTQTRRVVKVQSGPDVLSFRKHDNEWLPVISGVNGDAETRGDVSLRVSCPYGSPGDRLWVRETWGTDGFTEDYVKNKRVDYLRYRAGYKWFNRPKWRPSIHMPRWACRTILEITNVRVERLQDISEEDAKAEGVDERFEMNIADFVHNKPIKPSYRIGFKHLWDSIAKPGERWQDDPWVWVIGFKKV